MATRKTKREKQDALVEDMLFKKATGYTVQQQEAFKCKHIEYAENGKKVKESESVEVREVDKHFPPEMSAISFWLKARCASQWGDNVTENLEPIMIVDDIKEELVAED